MEPMGDPSWPPHPPQPGGGKEKPGESLYITAGWAEFGGIVLPPTTLSEVRACHEPPHLRVLGTTTPQGVGMDCRDCQTTFTPNSGIRDYLGMDLCEITMLSSVLRSHKRGHFCTEKPWNSREAPHPLSVPPCASHGHARMQAEQARHCREKR